MSKCFDVYIEPLVEKPLELWSGVSAFDITEEEGFAQLHTASDADLDYSRLS